MASPAPNGYGRRSAAAQAAETAVHTRFRRPRTSAASAATSGLSTSCRTASGSMKATTMVPSASSYHYVAGLNGCLEGWKKIVTCAKKLFSLIAANP